MAYRLCHFIAPEEEIPASLEEGFFVPVPFFRSIFLSFVQVDRGGEALGRLRRIIVNKAYSGKDYKPLKPAMLERLEPRIMLSGDGLLSCLNLPDPVQNTPAINTDIHIQNVEVNNQAQHTSENTTDPEIYKPIFTINQDNNEIENSGIPESPDEAFGTETAPGKNDVDELLNRFEELPESAKTSPKDLAFGQEISAQKQQGHDENLSLDDVALMQNNEDIVIQSNDSDENANNKFIPVLAVDITADETIENSTAVQTEDGSTPIYDSDAD